MQQYEIYYRNLKKYKDPLTLYMGIYFSLSIHLFLKTQVNHKINC